VSSEFSAGQLQNSLPINHPTDPQENPTAFLFSPFKIKKVLRITKNGYKFK